MKNQIKKMIEHHKKPLALSTWLTILITIIFTASILLFIFNAFSFTSEKENYIINTIQNNDKKVSESTNDLLMDMESMLILPLFNNNGSQNFFDAADQYHTTGVKTPAYSDYIHQVLSTLYNYKFNSINSVFFYNTDGTYYSILRGTDNIKQYNPKDYSWYNQCINDLNGTPVMFGSYNLYKQDYSGNQPTYVFGIARSVIDVKRLRVVGVLQININESSLYDMLQSTLSYKDQTAIIIDSNNTIISDTDRKKIGTKLDDKDILGSLNTPVKKIDNKLICTSQISWTNWKLINTVSLTSVNNQIYQTMGTTALIMLLLTIFSVLLAFTIVMRIIRPIKKLTGSMAAIGKGNFDVHINENSLKETAFLSDKFNEMTDELSSLVRHKYIDKINQKELEIKMLQYQINPHFIFNTLESIKMMSLIQSDNNTVQMLTSLGKFMRYSLSNSLEIVTIYQEIHMLEEYMSLLSVRFNDQYEFIIDVDPGLYEFLIPKIIFQPFVENAIEHGMSNTVKDGEIIIRGYIKDDMIFFEIKNNGEQISNERLVWLNNYINDNDNMMEHIGIRNVNKRIKLFFGEQYGVQIYSSPDGYTTVMIKIPKISKSEER